MYGTKCDMNYDMFLNNLRARITLTDEFGDGWSGAELVVHTPVHERRYAPTCEANPLIVYICASFDVPDQQGEYIVRVDVPERTPNTWEIQWEVQSVREENNHMEEEYPVIIGTERCMYCIVINYNISN